MVLRVSAGWGLSFKNYNESFGVWKIKEPSCTHLIPPSCTQLENHPAPSYCLRLSVLSLPELQSGAGISAYRGSFYYGNNNDLSNSFPDDKMIRLALQSTHKLCQAWFDSITQGSMTMASLTPLTTKTSLSLIHFTRVGGGYA